MATSRGGESNITFEEKETTSVVGCINIIWILLILIICLV